MQRKIIHIDMDAFYASVEQRDNPELKGKPLAVGGSRERGVVAAASYEARKFGVFSAMSSKIAAQKCPELIFIKPNFEKYKQVSSVVMSIFREYTDWVEPLSLDEAYLDVTENKKGMEVATEIAREIKARIKTETDLTASAGISYCKFLAKVASGYRKPDGLTVITPAKAELFIEKLKISDFFGIGKVTAEKMYKLGIHHGRDLKQLSLERCIELFGMKYGNYYFNIARGIDNRPVQPNRIRKSIGAEETYESDIDDVGIMQQHLVHIAEDVARRCERSQARGKTITLKLKYDDFVVTTRSKTLPRFIQDREDIAAIATELLYHPAVPAKPVRLLGITVHNLESDPATRITPLPGSPQLKLDLTTGNQQEED